MATGNKSRRSQAGITLMELLVVCVIIGILGAIALPGYRQYMIRTNRTDAKTALMSVAGGMERCFTRFSRYDDDDCEILDDYASTGDGVATEGGHYRIKLAALPSATEFTLQAIPKDGQAQDTKCATLSIDQAGRQFASGSAKDDAVAQCWRR